MEKECLKCHLTKPLKQFPQKRLCKDKSYCYCIICNRNDARSYYHNHKESCKKTVSKYRKEIGRPNRLKLLRNIRVNYGCAICGIKEVEVLDFHHFNPSTKSFSITSKKDAAMAIIAEEINKCVVLCANDHRRAHAKTIILQESMKCNLDHKLNIIRNKSFRYSPSLRPANDISDKLP